MLIKLTDIQKRTILIDPEKIIFATPAYNGNEIIKGKYLIKVAGIDNYIPVIDTIEDIETIVNKRNPKVITKKKPGR